MFRMDGDGPEDKELELLRQGVLLVSLGRSGFGLVFFFQAEDGIRDGHVTGVQTCALPISLAQWEAGRTSGAKLAVQLPFAIPGDAGTESVWVEVSGFDARTVTGRVMDDPLAATDVKRGDEVTRPRAQVMDFDARGTGVAESIT